MNDEPLAAATAAAARSKERAWQSTHLAEVLELTR